MAKRLTNDDQMVMHWALQLKQASISSSGISKPPDCFVKEVQDAMKCLNK